MSHDIISEIIKIMARYILTPIIERIRKHEYFSIIADGTRDISGIEQFSFRVRTAGLWERNFNSHSHSISVGIPMG